jgi:hypothetical protein
MRSARAARISPATSLPQRLPLVRVARPSLRIVPRAVRPVRQLPRRLRSRPHLPHRAPPQAGVESTFAGHFLTYR